MKKMLFFFVLFSALGVFAERGGLNVKDFGARGDGRTDDTTAIQQALLKLRGRTRVMMGLCPAGIPDQPPIIGVGELTEAPEIFFPAGTYRVSRTLVIDGTCVLRGESGSVIEMTDPERDIIYFDWAFRLRIEGMAFRGGRVQLNICTRNNESARVIIRDCAFMDSSGTAIYCDCVKNPVGKNYSDIVLPPYYVDWSKGMPSLKRNDLSGLSSYNNSTLFLCEKSSFINCRTALNVGADGATINDCDISAKNSPAIILGESYNGHSRLNRITCKASAPGDWILSSTINLYVTDSRFDGIPRTLIRSISSNRKNTPSSIVVKDTKVRSAQTPEKSVIVIENGKQENTPSIIELKYVRELSSEKAKAVIWKRTPTRETLLAGRYVDTPALQAYKATLVEWPYKLSFAGNMNLDERVPEALRSSVDPAYPEVERQLTVPLVRLDGFNVAHELHACDFGVDLDDATDDTAALQKLFDHVAGLDGISRLELPTSRLRISDALKLPPNIVLTARGRCFIMQTTPGRPLFYGDNIRFLRVENMTLGGMSNPSYPKNGSVREAGAGFDLYAEPDAQISFDDCGFYGIANAAIEVKAQPGNRVRLLVANSTFMTVRQVLKNSAEHAELNNVWITGHGFADETAVIENNMKCRMRVRNILTVPAIMKFHEPWHLPYVKNWPNSDWMRWIDNRGKLHADDNRWGGEWMGFCLVYNRDPRGTVLLDGNLSCFFSEWSRKCMLYCEYPPAMALLKNFGWKMRFPDSAPYQFPEFMKAPEILQQNIIY